MSCAWFKCENSGKWITHTHDGGVAYICHNHLGWPGVIPTTEEEYDQYEKLKAENQAAVKEDNRVKGRQRLRTNPDFVDIVSILRAHKQGLLSSEDAMQDLQTMVEAILGESL